MSIDYRRDTNSDIFIPGVVDKLSGLRGAHSVSLDVPFIRFRQLNRQLIAHVPHQRQDHDSSADDAGPRGSHHLNLLALLEPVEEFYLFEKFERKQNHFYF